MKGQGPRLRSGGDNAPTGVHREGELDRLVISTGSDAKKQGEVDQQKRRTQRDLMVKHCVLRSGAIIFGLK
jgi:hypothetical protein